MTMHAPYAARFSYGRLAADCGRALARGWFAILVGVVVLGVAPAVAVGLPWWRGAVDAPGSERIWLAVTSAKTVVVMVANAAREVFIAGVALKGLTSLRWRELLRPGRLVGGFTTALALDLLVNWPALAGPALQVLAPYNVPARLALYLAVPASLLVTVAFVGIAVTAAVAEDRWLGPAAARSFRLLRGLRWRMVALAFGYLVSLWVCEAGTAFLLAITGVTYPAPGLAQGAVGASAQLPAALFDIAFVSFFLQARRIADGPSADELHEVFA